MDPLSVTAAVAGLLTAAHEVAKLLGPYVSASRGTSSIAAHVRDEAESTRVVLVGLQTLVQGFPGRVPQGRALVGVDQVVAILAGGVLLFAELEGAVRGLVTSPRSPVAEGETTEKIAGVWRGYRLPLHARMQWARREESLEPLLARLQGFKVSVTSVLTLLQCDSDLRAEKLQADLAASVGALLDSNRDLSRRMMHLEDAFDGQTIRSRRRQSIMSAVPETSPGVASSIMTTASISETGETSSSTTAVAQDLATMAITPSALIPGDTTVSDPQDVLQSVFEFENDLETSRVYRRAQRDTMDFSFRSSIAHPHAWSMMSARSLADVSVLSVIALPLDLEEVTNRHHYVDTSNQELAPIAEVKVPAPKSEPLFTGVRPIFDDCLRIYFRLVLVPGFQELFDAYWQAQRASSRISLEEEEDEEENLWQQLSAAAALKSIFQKDTAYRLLAEKLGRDLEEVHRFPDHPDGHDSCKAVISSFLQLCVDTGFDLNELFCVDDPLGEDNVRFLRVLACVNQVLDRLVSTSTIPPIDEGDLETLVSDVKASRLLPQSSYKMALGSFVVSQRFFIRDLLSLVSALEKVRQRASLLFLAHQPLISQDFFSAYASSEIGLLLAVESMLLAPPRRQLWANTIHQWSTTIKSHCSLAIIEEQNAKQAIRTALAPPWLDRQTEKENRELVARCLDLLSKPSQEFARTARFFQEILDMLQDDSAGIGTIWLAQKLDFAEGQRLMKGALNVVNRNIRQRELADACKDLLLRVEDWKGHEVDQFGTLVQFDKLKVKNGDGNTMKFFHIYLFEHILLLTKIDTQKDAVPASRIRRGWIGPPRTAEVVDVPDKPPKLLLKGRIYLRDLVDITSLRISGSYLIRIFWANESAKYFFIYFLTERHMFQWKTSLEELQGRNKPKSVSVPKPPRPPTRPKALFPPPLLQDRALLAVPAAKRHSDPGLEPHRTA
ncbi:Pleckstrin homology domain-containing protein [Xylaria palmicola]|nr:Pleckstrin homology domain-containing protein [Xylaria palmicola]